MLCSRAEVAAVSLVWRMLALLDFQLWQDALPTHIYISLLSSGEYIIVMLEHRIGQVDRIVSHCVQYEDQV